MNVDRYLARLGDPPYAGPDLDSLAALMEAHLLRVPMENLDIHLGVPIRLEVDRFYRKIVGGKRGGGCYELNGLFAALLGELGYDVDLLSGRVFRPGRVGPEFDHLALRVSSDKLGGRPYLVDVGFGDGHRQPLELAAGASCRFGEREFAIIERDGALALQASDGGELDKGYILSPIPRQLADFDETRHEHHTDPRSWFVRTRLATIATPTGRRTLMNERYKITDGDRVSERTVADSEYLAVLRDDFGIEIPRVPRTKADRLTMRARGAVQLWRHRAKKLLGLGR